MIIGAVIDGDSMSELLREHGERLGLLALSGTENARQEAGT